MRAAGDIVLVAGDFNGFTANSATLMTDNGHNVWTATCNVTNTVGATENYKFLFLPFSGTPASVWEVDGLGPAGAQNRQFTLPALATNIPVAYFNNVTNPPNYASVTFNVNMAVQHARGTFTPGSDSISVAGNPLNNWTTGAFILTQSPTNADLYVGTFSVTNVGSTTSFKYVDSNTGIGNGGWETTPNRTTMVPVSGTNFRWFIGTMSPISATCPQQQRGCGRSQMDRRYLMCVSRAPPARPAAGGMFPTPRDQIQRRSA